MSCKNLLKFHEFKSILYTDNNENLISFYE
jgi:hypothetical protein